MSNSLRRYATGWAGSAAAIASGTTNSADQSAGSSRPISNSAHSLHAAPPVAAGHVHAPATPLARLEVRAAPRHQIRLVGLDHARRPHFAFRVCVDHFDRIRELPPITRVGLDAPRELGPARPDPERVTDAPVPASQRDDAQWNGHNNWAKSRYGVSRSSPGSSSVTSTSTRSQSMPTATARPPSLELSTARTTSWAPCAMLRLPRPPRASSPAHRGARRRPRPRRRASAP